MDAAGKTRIKASHRAHNIDALEFVGPVFFEDGRILHGVLIRPRRPVDVPRAGIPRCWRIGMIVGYLSVANDEVMRQHTAHGLVETAADCVLRHGEWRPRVSAPVPDA